jgi:hypothetical protein
VTNVMKYILSKLKVVEQDYIYEEETISETNEKGEVVERKQYKALSSRFIALILNQFNTSVAKNWARIENVLDIIHHYGVGEEPTNVAEGEVIIP